MKLHLPKLLSVAVMASLALPAMGDTLTNVAPEGAEYKQWNVGGGDISKRPAENVVSYTGDITLNSGDQLGYFKDGSLVTYDNGDGVTMHLVTYKLPDKSVVGPETLYSSGNKEFSNIFDIAGTLSINGTATVQLGGQYKLQKRTDTVDENGNVTQTGKVSSYKDDYSGLRADNVIINGTGSGTHLHSTSALIGNLTVNSGNVTLHTDQYSGNGTGQAFYNDNTSFKVTQIEQSLTQNGGTITMGRTKGDHSNTTTSHINNVFGTKDTATTITQTNGSLSVIGYSYARTGMTISQENGSISFRDVLLFSAAGTNTIEQTGNGTMVFGRLDSNNTSTKVDFDITQSGSGTIKFTGGTNLGRKKIDGVYVNSLVNITQSGNGNIIIGGGNGITDSKYPIKSFGNRYTTYNIDQTGAGTITVKSDATITADKVNVGKDATLNVDGNMTFTGKASLTGTVNVGANTSFTLTETCDMDVMTDLELSAGNSIKFIVDSATTEGSMQMTETGNLEFTGGTLELSLTEAALTEIAAEAHKDGKECHVTLIGNLSDADVLELEGIINDKLVLADYLVELELPTTSALTAQENITIEAHDLIVEDNALKAVVIATNPNVIPEPATATLSLLALAALAARRRRK